MKNICLVWTIISQNLSLMSGLWPNVDISKSSINERIITSYTSFDQNKSLLPKSFCDNMKGVSDLLKKWAYLSVENQAKKYVWKKMFFDMTMPWCKLVSLRSIGNERVMPQCSEISEMTKICCELSQMSTPWPNHLKDQ